MPAAHSKCARPGANIAPTKPKKVPGAPKNPLAKFPPKHCKHCDQNTHQYDKDYEVLGIKKWLHWTKTYKNASGETCLGGDVCYRCGDTLRAHYDAPPKDVLAKRSDKDFDQEWIERRLDRCGDCSKFAGTAKVNPKTWTVAREGGFGEEYEEGVFQELWAFARTRRLKGFTKGKPGDQERLEAYIDENYPAYEVKTDKHGMRGVELVNGIEGGRDRCTSGMDPAFVFQLSLVCSSRVSIPRWLQVSPRP